MATAGGVDEDDVEVICSCVGDGVFCDISGIFAVSLFVEFDSSEGFAVGEFF